LREPQAAPRSPRTQSGDGRTWEVGRFRSTEEAAEQSRETGSGGGGGNVYDIERLRVAYLALKRDAAAGVDGETWRHYGENLEANLRDLADRLKRGAYRAKPVRRAYIPKADRRVVRLIQKWLSAGVLEGGKRTRSEVGTVKGGSISPLLANVYLHYVFDLWVQRWRKKQSRGEWSSCASRMTLPWVSSIVEMPSAS
jgi:retron-type reverse transcriptase